MTLDEKQQKIIDYANSHDWNSAIAMADEILVQFPDNTSMFMLKKALINLKEQQYDLAKSLLENILVQEKTNQLVCAIYRICQGLIARKGLPNRTEDMTITSHNLAHKQNATSDMTISETSKSDMTISETSKSDMTISETSKSGITISELMREIPKSETSSTTDMTVNEFTNGHAKLTQNPVHTDQTISEASDKVNGVSTGADTSKIRKEDVEFDRTVVEAPQEEANKWDLESSAATMVMTEEPNVDEPSMFIDASTISKANRIGPYRDLIEIGRGGMGVVYKAYDTENNRYIALKTIREDDVPEEIKKRFVREMDIVSKLDHPNIIRIFDKFFYDDRMFFSMEFIDGKTLKELQEQGRPFPLEEIIEIVLKICDALEHAHEKGIIHRDLKPSNIMLDINNHVKVVDFGIAKKMDEEKYTRTGQVVGSIQYMPPEQMNGSVHDIDARSDIYTIGAILYEMIMKAPPFPVPKIKNEMPKKLKSICLKCLSDTKENRYQDASLLKKDLQLFASSFKETKAQKTYSLLLRIAIVSLIAGLSGYSLHLNNKEQDLYSKISQKEAEIQNLNNALKQEKITNIQLEGNILFRDNNYESAIEKYSEVLSYHNNIDTKIMRGRSYLALEKYEDAIKDFSIVDIEKIEIPQPYSLRGLTYQQTGDYDNAITNYEQALLYEENHYPSLAGLAEIYYEKQAWAKSEQYLLQILESNLSAKAMEKEAKIYKLLANVYNDANESHKAIKNILFAYFINPEVKWNKKEQKLLGLSFNNEPYLVRSLQLFAKKYSENAHSVLKKYSDHNGLFSAAIGVLYEDQKKYEEAQKWYQDSIEKKENFGAYRLYRLYFYGSGVNRNSQKAFAILNNFTKNMSPNGVLYFYLALSHLKGRGTHKNIQKAISFYEKGSALGNYDCMYYLGIMEYKRKNYEQSYKWMEKAASHHSSNALLYLAKEFYGKGYFVNRNPNKVKQLIADAQKIEMYYK